MLRYFDSREAIFLEVLDEEFTAWLNDVEPVSAGRGPESRLCQRDSGCDRASLTRWWTRQLLCELLGSMAGVLERNISRDFARDFKARAMARIAALAQLVARHLPWLPRSSPSSSPRAR